MNTRLIRAFAIAPLAPCLVAATFLVISNRDILVFPAATLVYALFAYSFALALGVPGYLVMSKAGWLSMPKTMVSGTVLGATSGVLLQIFIGVKVQAAFSVEYLTMITIFAVFGAITAWAFWLLALRPKRSNNTLPPKQKSGATEL